MGIGFDNEVADVARRIQAEAKQRGTHPCLFRDIDVSQAVCALARYATRLHRSYENACNREQSPAELRAETSIEALVMALCHRLGVKAQFNGDPRGAPIKILASKENANDFTGECIVVPYGSQREYDRAHEKRQREIARAAREESSVQP